MASTHDAHAPAFAAPVHPLTHGAAPRVARLSRALRCDHKNNGGVAVTATTEWPRVKRFLQRSVEGNPVKGIEFADAAWQRLRRTRSASADDNDNEKQQNTREKPPAAVRAHPGVKLDAPLDYDVIICGGTLGIFSAVALQSNDRSLSILVVEQGQLRGREQEWNISRSELRNLLAAGVLASEREMERVIASEFNPVRVGFDGAEPLYVRDILNVGVSPRVTIEMLRRRFVERGGGGGVIRESVGFAGAEVYDDCVQVRLVTRRGANGSLGAGGSGSAGERVSAAAAAADHDSPTSTSTTVRARLLLDCMGHQSPIVRQQRDGKPDSVCVVVGSCCDAAPFPHNHSGDLIYTFTTGGKDAQYFWEAFPSSGGTRRTTYMFTYLDADARRNVSLHELYHDYLTLLPRYQQLTAPASSSSDAAIDASLDALRPQRALFGYFPSYARDAPLPPAFDRILQIGDASGIQSPLSFGGFGATMRHLPRITCGVIDALAGDFLSARDLRAINGYQPSLSVTWLFQRAMSYRVGQMTHADDSNRDLVNRVLATNFAAMQRIDGRGEKAANNDVLRPFLQDVVQAGGLTRALLAMAAMRPALILAVVQHVGATAVAQWYAHYLALLAYAVASRWVGERESVSRFVEQRLLAGLGDGARRAMTRPQYRWRRLRELWRYGSGRDYFGH